MFLTPAPSFVLISKIQLLSMKHKMNVSQQLIALAVAASVVALSTTGRAEDHANIDPSKLPPAATKPGVTYAGDIKGIFEKSCVKCHGEEKPKAKLRLTSLEGALKGGADGKVIEPGNSAKSSLFLNVTRLGEEDLWMPPKDNKAKIAPLTAAEMGLIRAWIDQGAK
jgi:mono/diheme cytochrome c family protein